MPHEVLFQSDISNSNITMFVLESLTKALLNFKKYFRLRFCCKKDETFFFGLSHFIEYILYDFTMVLLTFKIISTLEY
jgi:hypothetical protein